MVLGPSRWVGKAWRRAARLRVRAARALARAGAVPEPPWDLIVHEWFAQPVSPSTIADSSESPPYTAGWTPRTPTPLTASPSLHSSESMPYIDEAWDPVVPF